MAKVAGAPLEIPMSVLEAEWFPQGAEWLTGRATALWQPAVWPEPSYITILRHGSVASRTTQAINMTPPTPPPTRAAPPEWRPILVPVPACSRKHHAPRVIRVTSYINTRVSMSGFERWLLYFYRGLIRRKGSLSETVVFTWRGLQGFCAA